MNNRAFPFLTAICLSAILIAGRLAAQPGQDYRLSPGGLDYRLPEDIRIQAAGRIGDARLVVWGTTVDDGSGNAVNALAMNLNGSQRVLTSPTARPYGAVAVIPLADRFLVMWNDRRNGTANISGRIVLIDGSFAGDDYVVSRSGVMKDRVYWSSGAETTLLLWNDIRSTTPETYTVRIDGNGRVVTAERSLGVGEIDSEQMYRTESGRLVLGRGGAVGYVVLPDGELDNRTIPAGQLQGAYYRLNDTALLILRDTVVYRYASIFDTLPSWKLPIPQEAMKMPPFILSKASIGSYILSHSIVHKISGGICIELNALRFDSSNYYDAGKFGEVSCAGPNGNERPGSVTFTFMEMRRGEHNEYYIRSDMDVEYSVLVRDYPRVTYDWYNSVRTLRYTIDSSGTLGQGYRIPTSLLHQYSLVRNSYETESTVWVTWFPTLDGGSQSTPVAPASYANKPILPNIVVDDSYLCVGWIDSDAKLAFARYGATFADAELTTLQATGMKTSPADMWQGWGGGGFPMIDYWIEMAYDGFSTGRITHSTSFVHQLRKEGWQQKTIAGANPFSSTKDTILQRSVGTVYNPNTLTAISIMYLPQSTWGNAEHLFMSNRLGDSTMHSWRVYRPFHHSGGYVPIDDTSGLYLSPDDFAIAFSPHTEARPFKLLDRDSMQFVLAQRLYGDRFLRILSEPSKGISRFEVYGLDGQPIRTVLLSRAFRRGELFCLQNASDHAIVLLWGSDSGIRCMYLSDSLLLEAIRALNDGALNDFRVSATSDSTAHPAAIFRNDTLFVVWEDFRDGPASEIYGTYWVVPKEIGPIPTDTIATPPLTPMPEDDLTSGIRIISVTPNPAIDRVGITVESIGQSVALIALYDALGRRALSKELILVDGVRTYPLDLSQLSSGSYTARVSTGTSLDHERLIILGR